MKDELYRVALVRQEGGTGYSKPICYTVNYDHALLIKQGIEALIKKGMFSTTSYSRPKHYEFKVSIDTFKVRPWFIDYFDIREYDVEEWFNKKFRVTKK
jgi:hypothetical protein